ncbi:MAG: imidazolonepropionase, partial [Lachnospiraceae bacterium]|nr:imidazolonepropionase [Lachnospiraceae bacterium]
MKAVLIENAKQLLTMAGESNHDIGLIENGSVLICDGMIAAVGKKEEVEKEVKKLTEEKIEVERIDATDRIVTPGFVDCHTHVTFGGSRVEAYAIGLTDDDPQTLVRRGIPTGIYASVNMTTSLDKETLKAQTKKRLLNMIANGTTTIEGKSGYALTNEGEHTMLVINRELNEELPLDIFSTFLGAHGWTEGMDKDKYIDLLCKEMIPRVAEEKLAICNDVWCDDGHYTAKESETILRCGEEYGLRARIHTDAYSYIGGSDLAAEMKMLSADHLNFTPPEVYPKLKEAGVTGVL